jgi:hypothetical protein
MAVLDPQTYTLVIDAKLPVQGLDDPDVLFGVPVEHVNIFL